MSDAARFEGAGAKGADGQGLDARLLEELEGLLASLHAGHGMSRQVSMDASLEADLGLDSLSKMELASRLERRFKVSLPQQLVVEARTPGDLLLAVEAASGQVRASPADGAPGEHVSTPDPEAADSSAWVGLSVPPTSVQSLPELLMWQAEQKRGTVHVTYLEENTVEQLTYLELFARARAVAGGLQSEGIAAGDAVGLMLPSGTDYFCAFLGVTLAGAVPVPIYPPVRLTQLEEHLLRHRKILDNAGVRGLISFKEARPVAKLLSVQVPAMRRVWSVPELESQSSRFLAPRVGGDDTAFLQYTSGSTGTPKGVVLSHRAVLASLAAMGQAVRLRDDDVFVSWLPLYHDMGLIGAWLGSLYHGMPLVLMSPLSFLSRPVRWLEAVAQHQGTLSGGPNFAYELCARRILDEDVQGLDLSRWRMAFNGAEPVNAGTMDRFAERFSSAGFRHGSFSPVYGLAEATLGVSFTGPEQPPRYDRIERQSLVSKGVAVTAPHLSSDSADLIVQVSSGIPIPGFEIRTVDASGRETAEREVGQVEFAGPGACDGYFQNSQATELLFDDRWVATGDLGYVAGGELFITGRVKDLIIRGGRNISPYELENAAAEIEGVRRGCVAAFGAADVMDGTERLVLVAETRERDADSLSRIRHEVAAAALEAVGQPLDEVVLLPPNAVLKTSSGKIRRVEMAAAYASGSLMAKGDRSLWRQLASVAVAGLPAAVASRWANTAGSWTYAAWWWICLAPASLLAALFTLVSRSPGRARSFCGRMARLFLTFAGARPTVAGLDHYPRDERFVLVCNHASYMDGLLLHAALPAGGVPWVVKGELGENAWVHRLLAGIGSLFVKRFDHALGAAHVDAVVERLEQGGSIGVFPEGTLHRMPGLLGFQLGGFLAAVRAGVPVVPVVIKGTRSMLRDGSWYPRPGSLELIVLEAVEPASMGGNTADDEFATAVTLRDAVRQRMLEACGEPDLIDRPVLRELADAIAVQAKSTR